MIKNQIRKVLITLLDDDNGISEEGYTAFQDLIAEALIDADDIFGLVEETEGRYYLPEGHGLI